MRVCTCVLGVVLGWLFLNNLLNCYISISAMNNEVVLTLPGYCIFWFYSCSIFFFYWLQVLALTLQILQPGSYSLLYTTGPITFHKLSHGFLGIVSVLHAIQYHKSRTPVVEQINLEGPVQLIQLSVAVTDSCREQKESNGV